MNCEEVKKVIQLYLDNELSARDSLEVQPHLEACSSCAALLAYFTRQDDALRAAARAETEEHSQLRAGILAAIQEAIENPTPTTSSTTGSTTSSAPSPTTSPTTSPTANKALRRPVWWQRPALRRIAALLVIAIAAGFFLLRGSSPFNEKVYADAVADHDHHCTLEILNKFEKAGYVFSRREEIDERVVAYSTLQHAPDLTAFGYDEPRAVICKLNGMKTLHIVYQSQSQEPLSIFIRRRDGEMIKKELLELTRAEHKLVSMARNGTELVVVAALDEAQALGITKAIAAQFGEANSANAIR